MDKKAGGRNLPTAVERVCGEFEAWRSQRRGNERIPEQLWKLAVRAARKHGVHPVSTAVGLEYAALKRRVNPSPAEQPTEVTRFVELTGTVGADSAGCVVEIQKGNGTQLRVRAREGTGVDWSWIRAVFLEV